MTVAVMLPGIAALVGIIIAVQARNQKLTKSFVSMRRTRYTIQEKEQKFGIGNW